jgi:hypothetical protein
MAIDTPARPLTAFRSDAEILEIIEGFRRKDLPQPRWTHQAHLTVGLWYVLNRPAELVLAELRQGITAYNEAVGTVNDDAGGYHETITAFYVWAIRRFVEETAKPLRLLEFTNALLASPYAAKTLPFEHYSRARLLSVAARRGWLEPDLKPLS